MAASLGVEAPEDLVLLAERLELVVVLLLLDQGLLDTDLVSWPRGKLVGEGLAGGLRDEDEDPLERRPLWSTLYTLTLGPGEGELRLCVGLLGLLCLHLSSSIVARSSSDTPLIKDSLLLSSGVGVNDWAKLTSLWSPDDPEQSE